MELSLQQHLHRKATGFAQESIATLILSGKYVGFYPITTRRFRGAEYDAGDQTGTVPLSLRILQRAAPLAGAAAGGEAVP